MNGRTGKKKVKSGCRTCKIRKVKCDEARPACNRCVSTGRKCDGYGIWDNREDARSNLIKQQQQQSDPPPTELHSLSPWRSSCISILTSSLDAKRHFEWFTTRTSKKIPGLFVTNFWTALLHPASLSEPAVLHAVLTLSSVHKGGVLNSVHDNYLQKYDPYARGGMEQFTLEHYISAIRHLTLSFEKRDKSSTRIALITCVVFVCLEFLRGHFRTAQNHLRNGLNVLRETREASGGEDGVILLTTSSDPIDDWILEAFARLYVQVELFNQFHTHARPVVLLSPAVDVVGHGFDSINNAWLQLESILSRSIYLTELARRHHTKTQGENNPLPPNLSTKQNDLQHSLTEWREMYTSSIPTLRAELAHRLALDDITRSQQQIDGASSFVCCMLMMYFSMASVMASTSLSHHLPTNLSETLYDSGANISHFQNLISHAEEMWRMRYSPPMPSASSGISPGPSGTTDSTSDPTSNSTPSTNAKGAPESPVSTPRSDNLAETAFDGMTPKPQTIHPSNSNTSTSSTQPPRRKPVYANMSHSTIDMGWLPPLYYTAVKCRVPSLRRRALRFMSFTGHREGMWDSRISAAVAAKVVEIEEVAARGLEMEGCFGGEEVPSVPSECRVSEVEVVLPDGEMERVGLVWRRRGEDGVVEVGRAEYDLLLQRWYDV